jgi:hypothetical protein
MQEAEGRGPVTNECLEQYVLYCYVAMSNLPGIMTRKQVKSDPTRSDKKVALIRLHYD